MKIFTQLCVITLLSFSAQTIALSLAPEEFNTSRKMACVLAQQSLGQLSENEYGEKANALLEGFDESERDNILAQAVGYYGGLMFSPSDDAETDMGPRLKEFVSSSTCSSDYRQVTFLL